MTSQPTATPTPPAAGIGEAPQVAATPSSDPALEAFSKLAAERRSRVDQNKEPVTIPFGNDTIRIYPVQPAAQIVGLAEAERDPGQAIDSIRACIIEEDRAKFEAALKLPPTNDQGIDGPYIVGLLMALVRFYGAVPLDAS